MQKGFAGSCTTITGDSSIFTSGLTYAFYKCTHLFLSFQASCYDEREDCRGVDSMECHQVWHYFLVPVKFHG